jgi:hypothetical protein
MENEMRQNAAYDRDDPGPTAIIPRKAGTAGTGFSRFPSACKDRMADTKCLLTGGMTWATATGKNGLAETGGPEPGNEFRGRPKNREVQNNLAHPGCF